MGKIITILIILAIAVALFIVTPLVIIWAVNTLFALGIEYTISTWAATVVLCAVFGSGKGLYYMKNKKHFGG